MSDDPSLVDTATLISSLRSDIGLAMARHLEAYNFLQQARATFSELERRWLKELDK
jgi:hypothetical protein